MPALFELGLVFGLLYARTRSVLPGMVAHLGSNLTATLLYVAGKGQDSGPTEFSAQVPAVIAASVLGWLVLGALLLGARRVPSAWGTPREVDVLRPRVPFSRALAPWAVAACLSLGGWGVANRRGLEIDLADVQVRVPPPRPEEPDWLRERRTEVDALRDDVRRGSASLDSYLRARRALAGAVERAGAGIQAGPVD